MRLRWMKRPTPDLSDARIQITHVREYYSMRFRNGDIFLDQSMEDDMGAVKRLLAALDVLEVGGWHTDPDGAEAEMAKVWAKSRANTPVHGRELDWSDS